MSRDCTPTRITSRRGRVDSSQMCGGYDSDDLKEMKITAEFNAAIINEDFSEIENLFADLYVIEGRNYYAYNYLLDIAIVNQKENSLLFFLDLIKKTFDSVENVANTGRSRRRSSGARDDFDQIILHVLRECLDKESYDLMHSVLQKFGGYQYLKSICLYYNGNNRLPLEKIYCGYINLSPSVPIEIAIQRNDTDYIRDNINYYDFKNDEGNLLEMAIDHQNIEMILLLINAGANVNHANKDYLWDAIARNNYEIVQILVDSGINCHKTFEFQSDEQKDHDKIINLLVNQNIDPLLIATVIYKKVFCRRSKSKSSINYYGNILSHAQIK